MREQWDNENAENSKVCIPSLPKNQLADQKSKKLHFIGLGHGGSNAVIHIYKQGVKARWTCISGFYSSYVPKEMAFINYQTRTGDSEMPYIENIALTDEMKQVFEADDYFIIITALGASVGTGLIKDTIDLLRTKNKDYLVICSLPFTNEGRLRNNNANEKKQQIDSLPNVYTFSLQSIWETEGEMNIRKSFARGDELFYEILKEKCPFL